jgi:DNA modification methylase
VITLLHGRAEDRLREIPNGSVSLTATSPPYGVSIRHYAEGNDYDFQAIAKELHRVTCDGGIVAWNEGLTAKNCDELPDPYLHVLGFRAAGFRLLQTVILRRDSLLFPNRYKCGNQFEFLWLYLKGRRPRVFNKEELRDRKNLQAGAVKNAAQGRRGKDDALVKSGRNITIQPLGYRSNVWDIPVGYNKSTKDHEAHKHCAIQSEAVSDAVIRAYTKPGDTVLDPFAGAGTTLKMAHLNGRHAIGIERAKVYVQLSARRLKSYCKDVVIRNQAKKVKICRA